MLLSMFVLMLQTNLAKQVDQGALPLVEDSLDHPKYDGMLSDGDTEDEEDREVA